jgi:hypothetical protein
VDCRWARQADEYPLADKIGMMLDCSARPRKDTERRTFHHRLFLQPSPAIGSPIDLAAMPRSASRSTRSLTNLRIDYVGPSVILLRAFACSSWPTMWHRRQLGEVLGLAALAKVGVSPRGSSTNYRRD